MDVLESHIARWRLAVSRDGALEEPDLDELEGHLREQVADLQASGLSADEAFLVGVKRFGRVESVSAEFARVHGDRLWRQLVLPTDQDGSRHPLIAMLLFAGIAAISIQIPRLVVGAGATWFYRDLSLFVLPVLAAYFVWARRMAAGRIAVVAAVIVGLAAAATFFPFAQESQTSLLVGIHLPIVLWFVVGAAYLGDGWSSSARRMDFVRFTGEWAIYVVLIALGGGALIGLTSLVLGPILPAEALGQVYVWVIPSGASAGVIVAAWLVEAKKSAIENIAPVLTAVFTPLFAVMLVISVVGYAIAGAEGKFDREFLLAFDIVLIVVVGLVVYGASARKPNRVNKQADVVRLITVTAAIAVDVLVLIALFRRVGGHGLTPDRVAALSTNLILLVNLCGTVCFTVRVLCSTSAPERVDRWQMNYLPIFAAWGVVAVLVLPLVFGFA